MTGHSQPREVQLRSTPDRLGNIFRNENFLPDGYRSSAYPRRIRLTESVRVALSKRCLLGLRLRSCQQVVSLATRSTSARVSVEFLPCLLLSLCLSWIARRTSTSRRCPATETRVRTTIASRSIRPSQTIQAPIAPTAESTGALAPPVTTSNLPFL